MQDKPQTSKQQRRCIVTGNCLPKAALIRFVISPDEALTPDIKGKLPGRGVWVSNSQTRLHEALKRKQFEKAFAQKLRISPEIDQQVEFLLKSAALSALKMANKAGAALYGFTKLMAALEKQAIISLLHAEEASRAEADKLDYRFRTNLEQCDKYQQSLRKTPYSGFTGEELSLAFGAVNVIHAGLKESGAAHAAITAMERHRTYLSGDPEA